MSKRVAILTGGGEVPGLNMCLKSLVYRIIDEGFEPIGVRKGWEGLINYNYHDPTTYGDNFIELTKNMVRPIDRTPGSFLHSSRINPREVPARRVPKFLKQAGAATQDLTEHIKEVLQRLDYQALLVVGDDDMLHYAAYLSQQGIPIIGIPKTVYNNINGTDYTIGFSTGLARGVAFIHELRALAGSREQIIVVETFGVNSGLSSLMTSFLAGADRAIIPEVPYDPERLARLVIQDKQLNPSNYAVVTVSDGSFIEPDMALKYTPHLSPRSKSEVLRLMTEQKAQAIKAEDEFILDEVLETGASLVGSGMVAAELLQHLTDEEVFLQPLSYLLRTGSPDGQDLLGATNFAILAVRLLKEGKFGRMTAYQQRYNLTDVDLQIVTKGPHRVDVDQMYDAREYKPKVNLIWAAQEK
jgi:ATP-dependent phosphofructokinase / diphosphate-dependent phosphofructokinase